MSTRRAKQLIYGALYIVIFLFVVSALYFIFIRPFTSAPPAAVCTSNTCTPTSTAVITTSSVTIFTTSPGQYTFLSQALDNDPDFGASVFDYQIDIYNASGTVIESVPAQSFIYPSQDKYLVVPNVTVSQAVDHAELEVTSASWIASSTLGPIPQFVVQNTQASMSSSTITVSGQLTNANLGSFEKIIILAVFNNGNPSEPTGVSQTELDNVQAQSTENFSVMYPAGPTVSPAGDQIIEYGLR